MWCCIFLGNFSIDFSRIVLIFSAIYLESTTNSLASGDQIHFTAPILLECSVTTSDCLTGGKKSAFNVYVTYGTYGTYGTYVCTYVCMYACMYMLYIYISIYIPNYTVKSVPLCALICYLQSRQPSRPYWRHSQLYALGQSHDPAQNKCANILI